MIESLSADLSGIIFSYLKHNEQYAYVSVNKDSYARAVQFRLRLELSYARQFCFRCKTERVAGFAFGNELIRTSAFCPKHTRGTNTICLTQSHAGKNASFARLNIVYWKNQNGKAASPPT